MPTGWVGKCLLCCRVGNLTAHASDFQLVEDKGKEINSDESRVGETPREYIRDTGEHQDVILLSALNYAKFRIWYAKLGIWYQDLTSHKYLRHPWQGRGVLQKLEQQDELTSNTGLKKHAAEKQIPFYHQACPPGKPRSISECQSSPAQTLPSRRNQSEARCNLQPSPQLPAGGNRRSAEVLIPLRFYTFPLCCLTQHWREAAPPREVSHRAVNVSISAPKPGKAESHWRPTSAWRCGSTCSILFCEASC